MKVITAISTKAWRHFLFSTILISIIAVFKNRLSAQNVIPDLKGSTSLTGQLWGFEAVGLNLNHNINHRISINAGLGVVLDLHVGTNIYLSNRKKKKTSLYIGAQFGSIKQISLFGSSDKSQLGVYLPIGFEYIALKGFTIQVDIGPNFVKEDWIQINTFPVLGSLKIGYTFRKKP